MRIFNFLRPKQTVTVSILHRRSDHPETVEFMNIYRLENNPDLDIKELMQTAFQKAHPDWAILGVNMQQTE
jgi:hypothetical protein